MLILIKNLRMKERLFLQEAKGTIQLVLTLSLKIKLFLRI